MIKCFLVTFIILSYIPSKVFASDSDTICYVYVSLRGDNAIVVFKMDLRNGALTKIYTEGVSGGPASLAIVPSRKYIYVARRSSNSLSAYRIEETTGRLTFINSIPAVDNPVYVATDKSGRYLLSAYYNASKAAVYSIGPDGGLQSAVVTEINTDVNPHAIITDPSNRFLYITNMSGNKILQYQFDSLSGNFSALNPVEVLPLAGTGPRHLVFHGTKKILYVVNEIGNSVTVYQLNDTTGTLKSIQTISTLPSAYTGTSKCADIHITQDNQFLYASNRGHESIAAFKTDSNGFLSSIGYYFTVKSPREFDIDPTGNFLYAAGETSNNLAWYKIDKLTGSLDSLGCFAVGKTPSWVLAVGFVKPAPEDPTGWSPVKSSDLKFYNSPNPFDVSTSINYYLDRASYVKMSIYDCSGKLISNLVSELVSKGEHTVTWNGTTSSDREIVNNVFFCKFQTDDACNVLKLVRVQ